MEAYVAWKDIMGRDASNELILLLTSICFCAWHLISIFINAYLPYGPVDYTVLHSASDFVNAGPLGASDNTVSGLIVIIIAVTPTQGEPSRKAAIV